MEPMEKLKKLLLKEFVDDDGNIVVTGLDLSDFPGSVFFEQWVVMGWFSTRGLRAKDIDQSYQKAEGIEQTNQQATYIDQSFQEAIDICQIEQKADYIDQSHQQARHICQIEQKVKSLDRGWQEVEWEYRK